jgi:hypothetical protein
METKYFYQVCNLFSIIEKIIDKEKFTTDVLCELMRGNYDDDFYLDGIHTNYRDEFTTNIYQIQDDKGREAYIKRQISLLGYSSIYEKNKDVLKNAAPYVFEDIDGFIARQNEQIKTKLGISTENVISKPTRTPAKYDGFLLLGLLLLLSIELLIKNNCSLFNFDYNKLVENAKLRGFKIYDIKKLMGYIFDISISTEPEPPQPDTPNTPPPPPPKQTTFKSLFVAPYCIDSKITELKKILETNGYTIKEQWRGITGKGNELAYLYHFLKSNPRVILTGEFKQQIKVFYNEFGLTVKDKLEPGVICVTKNLQKYSEKTDTYKDFESLFSHWVK